MSEHLRPRVDVDNLHKDMELLMIKHQADACRQIGTQPDGTAMFLLTTGQVYEHTASGECRQTGHHIMQPVSDFDGVQYVPFVHRELGTVGLIIIDDTESAERPVQFLYFAPLDQSDVDEAPNVSVYQGGCGYPYADTPRENIVVWERNG